MEIVLIPYWVANQLETDGLQLDTIFNVEKMLDLFTPGDLAGLVIANTHASMKSSVIFGDMMQPTEKQASIWKSPKLTNILKAYNCTEGETIGGDTNDIGRLNNSSFYNRILTPTPHYKGKEPYRFHYLKDRENLGIIGCVINPGFFYQDNPELPKLQFAIIRDYLKTVSTYSSYTVAAQSAIYGLYLKHLSTL